MSNQTTFQEKNARLNVNNIDLNTILETINNLPSAGSGGDTTYEDRLLDGSFTGEYINNRVTYLKDRTFYKLTGMTSATFNSVTNLGMYIFESCTSLQSISIPNATYLGTALLRGCSNLTHADFSNATNCGSYVFHNCTSLTHVELPKLARMQPNFFNNCSALTTLILGKTDTICTLDNINAFSGSGVESGTGYIYVPDSLVDSYKSATNWSTYASQIKGLSELGG